METVLGRAMSEFPTVSQSDLLQMLDSFTQLTPKEHSKLYKSTTKSLPSQYQQARLEADTFRLERAEVIPCKTTIETIKLTNNHRATINWKIIKPSQVNSQHYLSCTPTFGTLEKGRSVEIRICCVLFSFKAVLDLITITCSSQGIAHNAFLPIMLHIVPNSQGIREPYWSVDFSELTLSPSLADSASSSSPSIISAVSRSGNSSPASSSKNASPASTPQRWSPLSSTPPSSATPPFSSPLGSSHSILPILASSSPSSNIIRGTADLYGTRVFVRRWEIGPLESPPQACIDEIEVLQKLRHPNLVGFVGGRAELGQAYVITKFLENGPFDHFLKYPKGDGSNLLKRLEMLLDVAYGMAFLHGKGIVHRHLSTSIMMIDSAGKLRLTDFGQSSKATIPFDCYLAPELVEDPSSATFSSDVFSFGICMWEAACAVKPVRSPHDLAKGNVPRLSCDAQMLPDFVELINLCCMRDPTMRPPFSTIITELEAIRDTAKTRSPFHFALGRNKTIKDHTIPSLPRTLVFLDMASNVHLTDAAIIDLPAKLVHLDLSMCPNLSDSAIASMPPTLMHLDLSSASKLTDASIPAMPRALTFLSMRDNTNLTQDCLLSLPLGLLTLNLLNSEKLPVTCLPKFPKMLTDFHMPCVWIPTFKDEFVKLLPSALTTLHFSTNTTLTAEGIAQLPQSLRQLNLAANRSIGNPELAALPPMLDTLNIASASNLTDDGLQFLPKSLQHLNLSGNKNVGHLGVKVLPQCLVNLNLSSTQNLWDMSVRSLPRSITSLILACNKQLTDASMRDLPASLTELNLAANKNLTDNCVRFLPASLKTLNLFANCHFTDACIRQLPRSLTELNLSSNENLTDACAADLPRSLKILFLRKTTSFSDSCIKYLPRSITHLDLTAAHSLTDDCISDMPTSLITLELWKNKNLSQDKLRARLPSMRVLALNVQ